MLLSPKRGDRIHFCGGGRGVITDITLNFGFPMFEIKLDSGKTVTEARYRFDVFPSSEVRQSASSRQATEVPREVPQTVSSNVNNKENSPHAARMSRSEAVPKGTKKRPSNRERAPQRDVRQKIDETLVDDDFDEDFDNWLAGSQDEIQEFIQGQENKGTAKKTCSNLNTLHLWLHKNRGERRNLYDIPPKELNNHLCKFFIYARKANGDNYEPSTLKGMLSSFNRHLTKHNYPFCLVRSEEFAQLNMVLSSKQVQLKKEGKGNKPRKADCLTDAEVDKLYSTGQLGQTNPESLLHTVWFNNTVYFGMGGVTEHHDMKWGDLQLKTDSNNDEYVAFTERATKTRSGADPNNIREVEPKMWAQKENPQRCPVTAYKKFRDMRPPYYLKDSDPFYIATCTERSKTDRWYKAQPVGVNKLGSFMKSMAKAAGLTNGSSETKRLTNHSARKYVVQKLSDAGVPSNHIMQISGHKNIQSLNDYSSMNCEQHKSISNIIGGHTSETGRKSVPSSTVVSRQISKVPVESVSSTTVVSSQVSRSNSVQQANHTVNVSSDDLIQGQIPLFGNIYGGTFNITVNYNINQQHKRPVNRIIDSDSD